MAGWTPKTFKAEAAPAWRPASFAPEKTSTKTEARAFGYLNKLPVVGGFGDELTGALAKFQDWLRGGGVKFGEAVQPAPEDSPEIRAQKEAALVQEAAQPSPYVQGREAYRKRETTVAAERPEEYRQGELGGYATALAIPGGATATLGRSMATGAALGAADALGHSEADLTRGEYGKAALDTLEGTAAGTIGGAAGHGIAKGIGAGVNKLAAPLARLATRKIAGANAKLDELAMQKVQEALASASGELGGEVQKGNRLVENLMRLEASMAPAERAALQRLKASGKIDDLLHRLIGSNLDDLPGQAAMIEGKRLILNNLQANKSQAFDAAREALSSPWAQIKPRLVRYLPPLSGMVGMGGAGALVGGLVGGDMSGAALGALGGAGARPAYHAIRRMMQHPSIQRPLWEFVRKASTPDLSVLGRFGPMLAMAAAEGENSFQALQLTLAQDPEYLQKIAEALGLDTDAAVDSAP